MRVIIILLLSIALSGYDFLKRILLWRKLVSEPP